MTQPVEAALDRVNQWLLEEIRKQNLETKKAHLRVLQYREECIVRSMKHTTNPRVYEKQGKNLARIRHNISQVVKELLK